MRSIFVIFALTLLASSTSDFPPYKFGEIPEDTGLYKTVYQGCEIFIAVGGVGHTGEISFKGYPKSVSIATGRGCK